MQLYRDKDKKIELSFKNDEEKKQALNNFYREKIAPDNEKELDLAFLEKQFQEYLKKQVLHFMDKNYSDVVLLVGAGSSVITDKEGHIDENYGKTMQDISWNIFSELYGDNNTENNYMRPENAVIFLPEDKRNKFTNDVFKDKNSWPSFPLEEYISNLNLYIEDAEKSGKKVKNPSLKQAKKLKQFILLKIVEAVHYQYKNDNVPFKHNKTILKLLNLVHTAGHKLMVVTTNYDLAIEKSLENDDFTIFDGFEFGKNGKFNDDMFEWSLSKEVNNINTREVIYKPHVIDLLKIHGSIDWIEKDGEIVRASIEDINDSIQNDKNNLKMIFPTSNKYAQSYEEPYFDRMTRFQNKLRNPNTLLVTAGFSFGDNHISRMIINAIKHNSSLNCLITDYNIHEFDKSEDINDNWYELDKLRSRGYNIAFLKATMCSYSNDLSYYLG